MIKERINPTVTRFLDKGIIINLYIFALGSLVSKAITSISGGLIVIFWLVRLLFKKNQKLKSTYLDLPILVLIISILLSGIDAWSIKIIESGGNYILLALFFYATVNTINNLKLVKKLSYTALISMVIAAIYGFYQHYYLHIPRVNGFMFSLGFGNLLAIFMMFTIIYILWGQIGYSKRIGLILATIIFGMNLLFTKSRGAWLGFIAGLFSLGWVRDKKVLIFIIVLLLALYFVLPQTYKTRFISSFDTNHNRSNLGRIALWKGALLMYRDHFINGVGAGNFSSIYETKYKQPNTTTTVHAHNNLLQFMAETGIIGLVAFIWFMFKIIKLLYQGYNQINHNNWRLFILSSLSSIIIFNVQGLTEFNFGDAEPLRFFWFLLALNVVVINQLIPGRITDENKRFFNGKKRNKIILSD